jgi:hypothetical protein
VNLIDRDRLGQRICLSPLLHPVVILPLVTIQVSNDGGGFGPSFLLKAVGVRFFVNMAVVVLDFVFVVRAHQVGDKQFPNAVTVPAHLMLAAIPVVKVAQHRNVTGIGSPDGKIDP